MYKEEQEYLKDHWGEELEGREAPLQFTKLEVLIFLKGYKESLVTLGLPSVSKCTRCKELEFMITNGLGWEDLKDDTTYPID
jgi:hypothetical protein